MSRRRITLIFLMHNFNLEQNYFSDFETSTVYGIISITQNCALNLLTETDIMFP